jgi:hypothetical protein
MFSTKDLNIIQVGTPLLDNGCWDSQDVRRTLERVGVEERCPPRQKVES